MAEVRQQPHRLHEGWEESTLPTPVGVAARLLRLGALLDDAAAELERRDDAAVRAKQRREVAFARCFLNAAGSIEARKQISILDVADLALEQEIGEALVRSGRERVRTLRDQLEIARSVGAAVRAEMAATGWSVTP
jgi:hypothetical protein